MPVFVMMLGHRSLSCSYFQCTDLGRDLVPVVKAFKASEEATSLVPGL